MLFKIRSINELLRSSGNRYLGGEEKESPLFQKKYIYFNETTRVERIDLNCALKIIIFRNFAFLLELLKLFIFYYFFY